MSTFLLKKGFKWIGPKYFDLNKYSSNSSKDAFLILNILKELCESHNDYPLSLDKVEIKWKMSKYQLLIADFYEIPIGNFKKLVSNFYDKKKYVLHYQNLHIYLRLGLKLKKIHHILEFNG